MKKSSSIQVVLNLVEIVFRVKLDQIFAGRL